MLVDITYDSIISVDNLLSAWTEFIRGKRKRKDVQMFELQLADNILDLHYDLKQKIYLPGLYEHFVVTDPKRRDIHKASVRDRLVHHALYRMLYPFFDRRFIHDSYSCRNNKGAHKAIKQFQSYARQVAKNHTKTCWVLKCDIKQFFASIDHARLIEILEKQIPDKDIMLLLGWVIESFHSGCLGKGLPLGNLTSQLLVNIYLNEFDQFVKRHLKITHYIRYADDFVVFSRQKAELKELLLSMNVFLRDYLHLEFHPRKVSIQTVSSGVDFLGWVLFPQHQTLRRTTRRRIMKKVTVPEVSAPTITSYLGLLTHGDAYQFTQQIRDSLQRN